MSRDGFHFADFFFSDGGFNSRHVYGQALKPLTDHCLLCGPPKSGKTSLLFRYALSLAAKGKEVVIICKRTKIEHNPPLLPEGVSADDPALECIHFRYLETLSDLKTYAACFHLLDCFPAALIVDNISSYLQSDSHTRFPADKRLRDVELVKTLALLHEATVCTSVNGRGNGGPCQLLLSDVGTPAGPHSLFIFQRWCPLILSIQPTPDGHVLRVLPAVLEQQDVGPAGHLAVHYSWNRHQLKVQEVVQL